MDISEKQEQAKLEFQTIINDLVEAGWTPLKIARDKRW
jgi:hypothetical protein